MKSLKNTFLFILIPILLAVLVLKLSGLDSVVYYGINQVFGPLPFQISQTNTAANPTAPPPPPEPTPTPQPRPTPIPKLDSAEYYAARDKSLEFYAKMAADWERNGKYLTYDWNYIGTLAGSYSYQPTVEDYIKWASISEIYSDTNRTFFIFKIRGNTTIHERYIKYVRGSCTDISKITEYNFEGEEIRTGVASTVLIECNENLSNYVKYSPYTLSPSN